MDGDFSHQTRGFSSAVPTDLRGNTAWYEGKDCPNGVQPLCVGIKAAPGTARYQGRLRGQMS